MADAHDSTTRPPENSSLPASDHRETADFECNICFDLAHDPVITLCGHLHCWPCIYKWLRLHSSSHECPVCKNEIEEEKLIPLYGRGNTTTDPRLITLEIPHRPAGQRTETVAPPSPEADDLTYSELRQIGGFIPMAPAGSSNFGVSAGFVGMLSPIFNVGFHEFPDANGYAGSWDLNYGYTGSFGEGGLNREGSVVEQSNDENLKKILVFVLVFMIFDFLTI